MRVAVQMDPIGTMVVERDTSLALMLEAQDRGAELWWWPPDALWVEDGGVRARAHRVRVFDDAARHYETLETAEVAADGFDVILIRQDPPFDMGYVSNTYLLDLVAGRALVLNPPGAIRDTPEKLSTLAFPDLIPSTFVGRDVRALRAFAARHGEIVLKPSFMAGGDGVRRLSADAPDFTAVVDAMLAEIGKEPLVAQEFLPRVADGDKRLFLLGGEAVGAVRRLPKAGEFRANLHVGGSAVAGEVDARDREIAARVGPLLVARGILFAGLDVIDGRLTEINVTSPTLIRQLVQFGGPDLAKPFWDRVEALLHARRAA